MWRYLIRSRITVVLKHEQVLGQRVSCHPRKNYGKGTFKNLLEDLLKILRHWVFPNQLIVGSLRAIAIATSHYISRKVHATTMIIRRNRLRIEYAKVLHLSSQLQRQWSDYISYVTTQDLSSSDPCLFFIFKGMIASNHGLQKLEVTCLSSQYPAEKSEKLLTSKRLRGKAMLFRLSPGIRWICPRNR